MKMILIVLMAGLVGCSIPPFKPTAANKYVKLTIIIDNNIIVNGEKAKGLAKCGGEGIHRFCILRLPSIEALDDFDWYYWGKELGHAYYDDYHKGIEDIY
jgi:hypothetical protein